MAEAVLKGVLGSLTSLAATELGSFLAFRGEKEKLESMFTAIKATLEYAEEKQFSDKAIKDWVGKLKDAAYELDDILDECVYEQLLLEEEEEDVRCCVSEMVRSSSLCSFHPKHIYFRYKIAKRMKILSERLDRIATERDQLRLTSMIQEETRGVSEWRQTFSLVNEPKVYGREEDIKTIVEFLAGAASRAENLPVYPIVGQGGLGKTTLAKLIYNHRDLKDFQLKIWVCVSEDFGLERILKAIIEAASEEVCKNSGLEPMQRTLRKLLSGKRYLLVLDDVWDVMNQNWEENWQMLRSVLDCGEKGASVLVTTRFSNVAEIMGTIKHPHRLSELSEYYCWELFKHQAFGADEVELEELVVIGRKIVKKCGGVPLAAKAVGGLLRFHRNKDKWLNIMESNLLMLSSNEKSILPVLRLSYLNLPVQLRQCFAYCAIFLKDELIKKQYLIELWIANGFISSDGRLDAEDVGDEVWSELYRRSLFQDIETDQFGKVTSFKMHDLVHDLAQFVADEEICCITDEDCAPVLFERKRIHHLSDHRWNLYSAQLDQLTSLRTYLKRTRSKELSSDVLKCYSLRLLHVNLLEELSSSIGNLKYLTYLNLSRGRFKTLPESLCKLLNLKILKLDYCQSLQKLPDGLVRLKALQQLSLKVCRSLSTLPPYIGKVNSLRSLSMYFVGEQKGFLLSELGLLKLKRDLEIKHLERVKNINDAKESNMSSKQLNNLMLRWRTVREGELEGNDKEVLEALEPCTETLQSLRVEGYQGVSFPQWMSSPFFKNLTSLELWSCTNCIKLPVLRNLPSLKRLQITEAKYVKYVQEECYDNDVGFMGLEYLTLRNLPSLIRLSSEDGENQFPCLSTLDIEDCPHFSLQGLPSLKWLRMSRNPKLKVCPGLECLPCLEDLIIMRCGEVEGLQHMTGLKKLALINVPKVSLLQELRFEDLPLLRELHIIGCYSLMRLPTNLSLSRLEVLCIKDCDPELEMRCEKENGEDWPIIAHIPHVYTRQIL